jgi:RHS repeat-associated protein
MSRNYIAMTHSFAVCLLVALSVSISTAQVSNQLNTGYPENGIFHGTEIESVQINNGGLHVEIPIFQAKARGFNIASKVAYNSKAWTFHTRCFTSGGGFCEDDVQGDPLGYPTLAFFGAFDYLFSTSSSACTTSGISYLQIGGYTLREPDGTKHHFFPDPLIGRSGCTPPHYVATMYADDDSGWIMQINTSNGNIIEAISKSGTRIFSPPGSGGVFPATLIVDANGNQMSSGNNPCCLKSGWGGTDTLGRAIPANGGYYDSSGTLQTPLLTGSTSVAIQTHLCTFSSADTCVEDNGTWTLPNQLQLPNGNVYNFTYAQNGGGELASMTLPTGGQIRWNWGAWDEGGRDIANRTITANGVTGQWTYNLNFGGVVTDPSQKDTRYTCTAPPSGDGCNISKVEYFDGAAGASTLFKTISTDFQVVQQTLLPIRETTTWNQQNLVMKTETDWDTMFISGVGTITWRNPIERRTFDWGAGTFGAELQRVHSSYRHLESDGTAYLNFNIADMPTLVETYDGSNNLVAKTQNYYDGSSLTSTGTCQAPGVPNHDYCNTSATTRGNLTQVNRWLNTSSTWVSTTNTYDDLGNLLSTNDPLGHPTNFDYTDNWGGSGCVTANTFAFPTTITNALGHRTKIAYFPCTSGVQNKKDENDIRAGRPGTTYTYDLMNRPFVIQTLDANGQLLSKTSYSYNDSVIPLSITKTVTAVPDPDIVSTVYMDGLGRTHQIQLNDPEGNVTTDIGYDALGRKQSETNPHRIVSAATDGTTQYGYDALGRITDVIKQDNNTVHTDYAGDSVTVRDETNRQRRTVTDGLGRLIEVDEPGGQPSPGVQATASVTVSGAFNSTWVSPGSPHLAATGTALASVTMSDGSSHTFYFDVNQHLCQMSWNSSGWFDQDLTSMTESGVPSAGSSIAAVALGGVLHVFYQGANQHIYDMNWTGSIWQNLDMTAINGASPVSNTKMAIIDTGSSNTPMMFYEGTNQHLFCIYWNAPTSTWLNADLHSLSGATNLIASNGAISAAMWGTTGNIHALFLDTNQNLNRIVWSGTAWITNNLTSITGAALAVPGSKLTTIATGTSIDLMTFYEGAGQHIYSIYWNNSAGTYQTLDFTSWSGATNIAAVLTSLANNPVGPHMFYFSSNQHLDDMLWNGSAWVNADLTSLANTTAVPASGSSLSSHGTAVGNTYHIFFEGGNQHIYHTFYSPSASGWFNDDPLVAASNFVVDSGTVSLTISNGSSNFNATVCYGVSTNPFCAGKPVNASSTDIANALAAVLNGSGSPVNASVTGTNLGLTWRTVGWITATVASMTSTSDNPSLFPTGSFTSTSGTFSGGLDPGSQSLTSPLVTAYQYDALGNLTCVEQHGNVSSTGCSSAPSSDATSLWRVRRFTYDSLSRLTSATNPESGTITYQYNADSTLTSKTDARGVTTNYDPSGHGLDALHRITQKTYTGSGIIDPAVNYTYDTASNGVGRLASESTTNSSGATVSSSFAYDPLGRENLESNCLPSATCTGTSNQVTANYDAAGNLFSLTYPDGRNVATAYNGAGRMISVKLGAFSYYTVPQSQAAASWGYWPTGAMNRGTYHNGMIETTGYSNRLQASSISDGLSGSTPIFSKIYGYSDGDGHNNGNILSITDTLNSARNQTFSYDPLNRILTGAQADNSFNITYGYDPWGNMHESGTSNFNQVYDNLNRIQHPPSCNPVAQFCYDAAGNLLVDNLSHSYLYDAESRIKTVNGTVATYTYGPDGGRVRKDANGVATEYVYFAGNVIAEKNPSTGAWTDYIFGYGGKRLAKDTSLDGSGTQYYHGDHLGSARIMTDNTGTKIQDCTFNPFGEQVACSPDNTSNHHRFAGKEHDVESSLDLMAARYYGSSMGRFVQSDPLVIEFHRIPDPQLLNLYSYARNNPLSYTDDTGLLVNLDCSKVSADQCKQTVGDLNQRKDAQFQVTRNEKTGLLEIKGSVDTSKLSQSESALFNAISDTVHEATLSVVPETDTVTFGRFDGNGHNTLDRADLNLAGKANAQLPGEIIAHEALEAYGSSAGLNGNDYLLWHGYANQFFGDVKEGQQQFTFKSSEHQTYEIQDLNFRRLGISIQITRIQTPVPGAAVPGAGKLVDVQQK